MFFRLATIYYGGNVLDAIKKLESLSYLKGSGVTGGAIFRTQNGRGTVALNSNTPDRRSRADLSFMVSKSKEESDQKNEIHQILLSCGFDVPE